jgi:hypothetical protein
MALSEAELQLILHTMREGGIVRMGCTRAHSTLGVDRDGWYWETFDEGRTERFEASEADLHRIAETKPEELVHLLQLHHWNSFRQALADNDNEFARKNLYNWLQYGDRYDRGKIWLAILDWPKKAPNSEIVRLIREHIRGYTAYHLFMDAYGWPKGPAASASALAFLDLLLAMVDGQAEEVERLRDGFERLASA